MSHFKVSALANFAHVRYYTDIQCKSIIYMLDSNIVLWAIRIKKSEKIIRHHRSKCVNLITPWGGTEREKFKFHKNYNSLWEK